MKGLSLACILAAGCTAKSKTSQVDSGVHSVAVSFDGVLDALAGQVMLEHFEAFEEEASEMVAKGEVFCEFSDVAGLEAVRSAWWAVREPWKHAEIVQFGPVVEYPERLGPKIDDWPVNQRAVDDKLVSDAPLTPEAFDGMGSATRGLPVVEYLLWGAADDTIAEFETQPRRCEMLIGASQDIHSNAVRLRESWTGPWAHQLRGKATGEGLVFEDEKEVVDQWVNRLVFTVENIRETKLGKPKGDSSNGSPAPDLVESPFSERSLQDALDVLSGVQDVWSGGSRADPLGVRDLIKGDNRLVERVDKLFEISRERLDDVPETLGSTIYLEPEMIDRAQSALVELQKVLQSEVAANVGITIRFNDNDGD